MAFLDTLGKTLSEKGKEAAKKAKDLTETMQLKAQISGEENNLKQAYQEAGRLAFESGLTAQADEYETIFSRIKESKTRIAQLEDQIRKLEGVQTCPACGARVPAGAGFCNSCGSRIVQEQEVVWDAPEVTAAEEEAASGAEDKVCPECGAVCDHDSRFCMTCGHAF